MTSFVQALAVFAVVHVTFGMLNAALTVWAALIETVQPATPEHPAPDQPAKTEPPAGVAVKVTLVPGAKLVLQVAPHEIPAGVDATVPDPPPLFVTVSTY
jgi:hypothetical protein